jgi:hypothetical protein
MSANSLKTISDVSAVVKPIVDDYKRFQSHKEVDAAKLKPYFQSSDSEGAWTIVVEGGKFKAAFLKDMGKARMRYLRKLLYVFDKTFYSTIKFLDED